ncbi:hypothetical protein SRHO_G00006400 [Serrasalmus rhombeus]
MATTLSDDSLWRRNSKLETFLKRSLERDAYERIRAYEPCVVVSETLNKVFMHVVLSDECIYLTEYSPRTLQQAVHFTHILDIELINDLPDFLRGRERDQSLHIRIVHTSAKDTGKRNINSVKPQTIASSTQQFNYGVSPSMEGISSVLLSTHLAPSENTSWRVSQSSKRGDDCGKGIRKSRSASCPAYPTNLRLALPQALVQPQISPDINPLSGVTATQLWPLTASCRSSVLGRQIKTQEDLKEEEEKKEAELHLYAVSLTSRIYLQLQSSWNSYIMRSTLTLDSVYMKTCSVSTPSPKKQTQHKSSGERTSHLFSQLIGELLQEKISLESLYLLLQELFTATHRNPSIKKFFWRCPELYPFLVKTLEENSQLSQDGLNTIDRLLLSTLVVQTLSVMFRETELEPARLSMLTSKQGGVTAAMLLALVCDPELRPSHTAQLPSSQTPSYTEALQAEYLDAASVLLFEVVMFCLDASRTPHPGHFLTVSWVFRTLKSHPFLPHFMGYQAKQVVLVLSDSKSPLIPSQAVLLYQRCHVLLACLHYSTCLSTHITSEFQEEFRYYVKISGLEDKLPPHYPISLPARHLISQLLSLMLHRP